MRRKILTMITIGLVFLMLLAGCGNSSRKAGLYQSDGNYIAWDDLNIDVESGYDLLAYRTDEKSPYKVFTDNDYHGELVFPNDITEIGFHTFQGCTSLTGVDLGKSKITSIGWSAFDGCISLTSIDLSKTQITSIAGFAFNGCTSLTSIDLPDTLTRIGDNAFSCCYNLTEITIPDSVTSIEGGAFSYCKSLTEITIPDSVTSIGDRAFKGCDGLTVSYQGQEYNSANDPNGWWE